MKKEYCFMLDEELMKEIEKEKGSMELSEFLEWVLKEGLQEVKFIKNVMLKE